MAGRDCYFDANGCYVCPELAAVTAAPAITTTDPQLGWNAGGNTVAQRSGDLHVVEAFAVAPVGIVFGLKTARQLPTEIALIAHGLYVHSVAGNAFVAVYELGRQKGGTVAYVLGTSLEIRRVGSTVTYWNDGVLLAQSPARVLGPVVVNACFYAAGDTAP
jgi:hypothetical protein